MKAWSTEVGMCIWEGKEKYIGGNCVFWFVVDEPPCSQMIRNVQMGIGVKV